MAKRVRWSRVLAVVAVLLGAGYWWLFVEAAAPRGEFHLDLSEVRRLASSLPGERASAVRVERVGDFQFPGAIIRAGDGWGLRPMSVYAYQLVFPGRTLIVDTALQEKLPGGTHDEAAWARLGKALEAAETIVVTHEHVDHLGGLLQRPNAAAMLKKARLTVEQISHPEMLEPARFPPGALDGYQPLAYERYLAIAPGVVLIRAPGHTPGSQLVYVQRADGAELLLLGDVAWGRQNIESGRDRPRAIALVGHMDRPAVTAQLEELRRLLAAEPRLHQVPGHDRRVIDELVAGGLLQAGFPE